MNSCELHPDLPSGKVEIRGNGSRPEFTNTLYKELDHNKYITYDYCKQHLQALNLSPKEYQSRIKKIADALDI